jgi:excisionase family DNA binding protein
MVGPVSVLPTDRAGAGPVSPRRTYSVTEAARLLGISRTKAYECIRTGELPALRFGRRIVVPAARLDRLLDGG